MFSGVAADEMSTRHLGEGDGGAALDTAISAREGAVGNARAVLESLAISHGQDGAIERVAEVEGPVHTSLGAVKTSCLASSDEVIDVATLLHIGRSAVSLARGASRRGEAGEEKSSDSSDLNHGGGCDGWS